MSIIKVSTDIIVNIESCNVDKLHQGEIKIKGWAFSKKTNIPLDIVVMKEGMEVITITRHRRQDVLRKYPMYEGALNSGFEIKINNRIGIEHIRIDFKNHSNRGCRTYNINIKKQLAGKKISVSKKTNIENKVTQRKVIKDFKKKLDNNKKICFITCVNNIDKYTKTLKHINALKTPKSFEVEKISITDGKYMTEAYNRAMSMTDAKYKVYIHQDVYITNPNFISDVINIFQQDKKIGMIGVAGAKNIPVNGVLHHSNNKYGHLIHIPHLNGKEITWKFGQFNSKYEHVKGIDGLMIVTQYDIPWREDVFDGWHFYDVSQSLEFLKAGFKVVVPNMNNIWCIHDCPKSEQERQKNYEKYRKIFIKEYRNYLG